MDKLFYEGLLEKAIIASKSMPDCIKTKGFFKWRTVEGNLSQTRYDNLERFPSTDYEPQKRGDIFLINELDENNLFYAIHATFVGTYRYKFKLNATGEIDFLEQKLLSVR
jgi:hypothetical protein